MIQCIIFIDGDVPCLQVNVRYQVLVVFGDQQASGLLVGVNKGWVYSRLLHRKDHLGLDVFNRRSIEKDGIIWYRLTAKLLNKNASLFF